MSHIPKKPSSWTHFAQRTLCVLAVSVALMTAQCGSTDDTAESPPCDQTCQDGIVARAVRQTIKVLYNSALPGEAIGTQDYIVPCPQGGSLHITGTADSNPKQGITMVDLSYEFNECGTLAANASGWDLILNGVVTQKGTLPSTESTTALIFESKLLQYEGTVSRPAISVQGPCLLQMQQDGGTLTGKLCKREFETGLLVGV